MNYDNYFGISVLLAYALRRVMFEAAAQKKKSKKDKLGRSRGGKKRRGHCIDDNSIRLCRSFLYLALLFLRQRPLPSEGVHFLALLLLLRSCLDRHSLFHVLGRLSQRWETPQKMVVKDSNIE